jgi:hypothetical protein
MPAHYRHRRWCRHEFACSCHSQSVLLDHEERLVFNRMRRRPRPVDIAQPSGCRYRQRDRRIRRSSRIPHRLSGRSMKLHAGIGVEAEQRQKLERLTRYVSRPAISEERLDLTAQGEVRYRLKNAYRDGTTHIVLEPLDCIARLAAEQR